MTRDMTHDDEPGALWKQHVAGLGGADYAHRFARRFDEVEASGGDPHGEARFVAGLVPPGARVLDAGCGTGRVAARLHQLGYDVTGVDVDEAMVAVARERWPALEWHVADLGALELPGIVDLVVLAGNVVPFISPGALPAVAERLASVTVSGGLVVCGFGLDADHLPPDGPVVPLASYDEACAGAGLALVARHAGWDGTPYDGGGYAVSVHRRP